MKKISVILFLIFSVITLKAEDIKIVNPVTKTFKVELTGNGKTNINAPEYFFFHFGDCWYLFKVENGWATQMTSANYIGTTVICNAGSQNIC